MFEFVFVIPIMGIGLGFFGVWTAHKQKMVKLQIQLAEAARKSGPQTPEQSREVRDLQERVRVLERIVTDGGYDLASQIEALRDQRKPTLAMEPAAEPGRVD